jgi:hypothetical protein
MATLIIGQKVKFLNPFPDEDPNQEYIIIEVKEGLEDTRIDISPLNLRLEIPPIYTVKSDHLVLIE